MIKAQLTNLADDHELRIFQLLSEYKCKLMIQHMYSNESNGMQRLYMILTKSEE